MNEKDSLKLENLKDIFHLNYKVTRLYQSYLENFPEIITKDLVEELTSDGDFSEEEIIVALLSEVFGLDMNKGDEDRRIIIDYLTPSVRVLNPKKYTENPYYKNIHIENIKYKQWEFKNEVLKAYRGVICDDMIIMDNFREIPPLGFFKEDFRYPAVLEGGNEWMTLTPVDLDTCQKAIEEASGKVVTFGLGLGYYTYMVSQKEEVESVTVVELSEDIKELFEMYILPQFPNKDKVKVVISDAFEYAENVMPNEHFNYAFVDTWRDAGDGSPMYERMKRLEKFSPETKFSYWIENFLISHLRSLKYADMIQDIEDKKDCAKRSFDEFKSGLLNLV